MVRTRGGLDTNTPIKMRARSSRTARSPSPSPVRQRSTPSSKKKSGADNGLAVDEATGAGGGWRGDAFESTVGLWSAATLVKVRHLVIMMMRGGRVLLLDLAVHSVTLLLFVVVAPIGVPFLTVTFGPLVALGLFSSENQVGVSAWWLQRYRPRYVLPLLCNFVLGLLYYSFFVLQPFVWFAMRVANFIEGLSEPLDEQAAALLPPAPDDVAARPGQLGGEQPHRSDGHLVVSQPQQSDDARYREHASVWAALEGDDKVKKGDVRLLSLKWLMALGGKEDGVLSRRQDLEENEEKNGEKVFLDARDLKRIMANAKPKFDSQGLFEAIIEWAQSGSLRGLVSLLALFLRGRKRNADNLVPVVAVSYPWLEAAHPDRHGYQLRLLCSKLEALYGSGGLLGACKEYGFSDMGVFIDWGSGYQKDPELWRGCMSEAERQAYEKSRTDEQKAAFDRMLHHTMDIWYAHACITVVLLTVMPDELPEYIDTTRTYAKRGWTTYERCSAELAKSFNLKVALWKLVIDMADPEGGAARRLPTTPERMAELLKKCQFTNGADKGRVLALYQRTASAVLGSSEKLDYMGLPLKRDSEWCSPARLGEALNHCKHLRHLVIKGTQLDDDGMEELAATLNDDALPALEHLNICSSRYGAHGVKVLFGVLDKGVARNLRYVAFGRTPIGDDGAETVAQALKTRRMPLRLKIDMIGCSIGDRGAKALADALPHAGAGCRVVCNLNNIGFAGQTVLCKALEAKHGWDFANAFATFANPPPTPLFLSRALVLGARRMNESGRYIL